MNSLLSGIVFQNLETAELLHEIISECLGPMERITMYHDATDHLPVEVRAELEPVVLPVIGLRWRESRLQPREWEWPAPHEMVDGRWAVYWDEQFSSEPTLAEIARNIPPEPLVLTPDGIAVGQPRKEILA